MDLPDKDTSGELALMNRLLIRLFIVAASMLLCQCATPGLGVHTCAVVLPGSSEVVAFKLKSHAGVARKSQVMAAMERVEDVSQREMKAGKDPLTKIAAPYSPAPDVVLSILSKIDEVETLDGKQQTVMLPMIAFAAPDVPADVLARSVPEIQAYVFRKLSAEFKPVRSKDLKKQAPR